MIAALRNGDAELGASALSTAQARVQEAQTTIEQVQKARSLCDRDPAARLRETERLRAAMSQAESYQADLERDFAPSSWSAVGRNLEQAQGLLATFDRQVQDAARAASSSSQEYLKGARTLEELARQQQIVLRLMSGLGEQLNSLVAVRNESRSLDRAARSERASGRALIRQNEAVVGPLAAESLAKAQQARQEILLRSGRPRPDWPALRQSLAEGIENMSIARSQAEEDIKNFEQLNGEFEGARRTSSRVYALLSSHQEDRLAANQHYQAAADSLDRIAISMQEPRGIAASLLAQVRDAAADLERSEELARERISVWLRKLSPRSATLNRPFVKLRATPAWGSAPTPGEPNPSSCRPSSFCSRRTTSSRSSMPGQPRSSRDKCITPRCSKPCCQKPRLRPNNGGGLHVRPRQLGMESASGPRRQPQRRPRSLRMSRRPRRPSPGPSPNRRQPAAPGVAKRLREAGEGTQGLRRLDRRRILLHNEECVAGSFWPDVPFTWPRLATTNPLPI